MGEKQSISRFTAVSKAVCLMTCWYDSGGQELMNLITHKSNFIFEKVITIERYRYKSLNRAMTLCHLVRVLKRNLDLLLFSSNNDE